MSDWTPGFKLVPSAGLQASVEHGHGHFHSKAVAAADFDALITVLKSNATEEEKAEIDAQLDRFVKGVAEFPKEGLMSMFSASLLSKIMAR